MSTTEVDAPDRPAPAPPTGGGIRGFADRWPFRRKLNVLVGVPLAVVAALLAYLIADQVGQARDANSAARLVRHSAQVAELVDRVEREHQQAILLAVRYEAVGTGAKPSLSGYRAAQTAVDEQVEKVRDTFGDRLPDSEAQALKEVNGLAGLRATVEQSYLPADNIDPAYTNAAQTLIDGLGLDRNPALAATFTGNLLDSLLRADAAHGSFETGVFSARTGDTNALIEFTGAVGSYELYAHQADRFARFSTEAQADELGGIEHNAAQAVIGEHYAELQVDPSGLQADTQAKVDRALSQALASYPDYGKQSQARLKVTSSLIGQIAERADDASSDAAWRAVLLLGLALSGFALWIALAVVVRRSVVRPVQALTGAAREVAEVAGRELARVADDDAEDDGPPLLREMPVTARDEIGDLAEAFNHVQTTASALLERQVLSRRNVAEMFGNVGRRVSNLTTRQLALIDAVERGETDPALLERLYSIDHIAVRLRRNADSLMLLAGIRETVLDSGPTALTNVVRAALGQIEGFQRVRLRAGTEVMVEPDIIGDLTLMVAELMENAVSFSPAGSPVEVTVHNGDRGALIVISDHGLGMSAERLAEENARLIRRERLDVVPTKVLGLFVVGTLARRWDIAIALSRTPGGGVTAEVTVPSSLLLTMSPVGAGASAGSAGAEDAKSTAPAGAGSDRPADARGVLPADSGRQVDSGSVPASGKPVPARPVPSWALGETAVASASGDGAGASSVSGPVPAAVQEDGADGGLPAPLPRRVPRREADAASGHQGRSEDQPFIPTARTEEAPATARSHPGDSTPAPQAEDPRPEPPAPDSPDSPGSSRPLRRRVRGATLRTTADDAQQTARQAARPADAEAVRAALDEFEAAVERAHQDSGTSPRTDATDQDHQNHLPEGAEQ